MWMLPGCSTLLKNVRRQKKGDKLKVEQVRCKIEIPNSVIGIEMFYWERKCIILRCPQKV